MEFNWWEGLVGGAIATAVMRCGSRPSASAAAGSGPDLELLYFSGCPHWRQAVAAVDEAARWIAAALREAAGAW